MSGETGPDKVKCLEGTAKVQWRRDKGYFIVVTLLFFLLQAAAIAISTPNIPAKPHIIFLSAWAAWLVLRIVRKRRERKLLENVTIQLDPTRPNLGGELTVTLTLNPKRHFVLLSWSVTALCTQTPTDEKYIEDEGKGICKLERVQHPDLVLTAEEQFQLTDTLAIPADVPPTGLNFEVSLDWFLYVDIELAASPVWRLEKPIPLVILP